MCIIELITKKEKRKKRKKEKNYQTVVKIKSRIYIG